MLYKYNPLCFLRLLNTRGMALLRAAPWLEPEALPPNNLEESFLNNSTENNATVTAVEQRYSSDPTSEGDSEFKLAFKYFKARENPPDMSMVVDVYRPNVWKEELKEFKLRLPSPTSLAEQQEFFLTEDRPLVAYQLKSHPGLILVRNAFSKFGQLFWSQLFLRECTERNVCKTNIDSFLKSDDVIYGHDKRMKRLRWCTLGYHYNWDDKFYSETYTSPFPSTLAKMSEYFLGLCGFDTFKAETGIINFYQLDSTFNGHVDNLEWNQSAPLISFSFGQTALFLLGGQTLNTEPVPLFLRSGDVMIMSGESRLCYHGIPRILKETEFNTSHSGTNGNSGTTQIDSTVVGYLNSHRINATIRQVK